MEYLTQTKPAIKRAIYEEQLAAEIAPWEKNGFRMIAFTTQFDENILTTIGEIASWDGIKAASNRIKEAL